MRSNKGFTLIELLITIAILSVVLTTVTSVILTGSKQFKKGSADADMQRQAQLVVNQIEDMVIDTNGGVYYTDYTATREFVLYNAVSLNGTVTYTKELIKWTAADEMLTYSKWNVDYDSTSNSYAVNGAAVYADQLMAEDITDFKIDLSDTRKEKDKAGNETDIVQSVQITVGCSGSDGLVSYATSPIITLRNRMMLSDSPELIFPNTPVMEERLSIYIAASETATPVKIQYPATTVERGKTYKLYLMVNDSYAIANNLIDWEITDEGIISSIASDGTLIVGATEGAASLSVKAAYKDNTDKNATATVKIVDSKEIKEVKIIPIGATDNNPFKPQFDSAVILDGFLNDDIGKLMYVWSVTEIDEPYETFDGAIIQENGKSKLKLSIKDTDSSLNNNRIRIHLLVTAPDLGITDESSGGKSTYYDFTVPRVGDTNDSYIQRGNVPTAYDYILPDGTGPTFTSEYYFCKPNGEKITYADTDLVNKTVSITSNCNSFTLNVLNTLPIEQDYYLKYVARYGDYTYERIFYIPKVQIIGQNTTATWTNFDNNHASLDFKLYGYNTTASDNGNALNKDVYEISVENIECNIPEAVSYISVDVFDAYSKSAENNLMGSEVKFKLSDEWKGSPSDIKVHSITVKIQMKNTEIFAYSTLTFTE